MNMTNCLNCTSITLNPKFCNSSCSASYHNRIKPKRTRSKKCKNCTTLIKTVDTYCSSDCKVNYRTTQQSKSKLKSDNVQKVISWRQRTKLKAVQYMGGKCKLCKYNKCVQALQFHHLDPTQKDFSISGKTKSWESIKAELNKCIMLCGNCHTEVHYGISTLLS